MANVIKLNKNMENEKLTQEEFDEIKQNHLEYEQAVHTLGTLELNYVALKEQLNYIESNKTSLLDKIKELTAKKIEIGNKLGEKYGDKQVDLETGELS